jgi:hypothetical protein
MHVGDASSNSVKWFDIGNKKPGEKAMYELRKAARLQLHDYYTLGFQQTAALSFIHCQCHRYGSWKPTPANLTVGDGLSVVSLGDGFELGLALGNELGNELGAFVGALVGAFVGFLVGDFVGFLVGDFVGALTGGGLGGGGP